jgi:hypothetical protein
MGGTRLRPGDILELDCGDGVAYFSYVGRHPILGDTIWVVPAVFDVPLADPVRAFTRPGYYAFYPAHTAVRQKLIRGRGFSADAMRMLPKRMRNVINLNSDGSVASWLITDGISNVPRRELTPEEQTLPIAAIWNHPLLVDRIRRNWSPASGNVGID